MKTTKGLLRWLRIPWAMPGQSTSVYVTTSFALKYISAHEMIAVILTKLLPKHRFEKLVTKLGMKTFK